MVLLFGINWSALFFEIKETVLKKVPPETFSFSQNEDHIHIFFYLRYQFKSIEKILVQTMKT